MQYKIKLRGETKEFNKAIVMGILNITPDSFYSGSRKETDLSILSRTEEIIEDGAKIIDLGAYSSRPNATYVEEDEEWNRLDRALNIVSKFRDEIYISVDSFRGNIIKKAYEKYGIDIVNDISAFAIDPYILEYTSEINIPYILMHMRGTPDTMMQFTDYTEDITSEVIKYFQEKLYIIKSKNISDIILDPGFGFSKTLEQNYELMANIDKIANKFDYPILSGISRKSMIYKLLDKDPSKALNGTIALNTISLIKKANILRVHDVKEAIEVCKIYDMIEKYNS